MSYEVLDKASQRAVEVLNRMLLTDSRPVEKLVHTRFECNQELADDPSIQVLTENGKYAVGFLGVINGILGIYENGWGPIVADVDEHGHIINFRRSDISDWT